MAKKDMNNPNKPAVKTRSVKGTKVQTVAGKTYYSRDSKPAIDNTGKQTRETLSISKDMKGTKKAIRKSEVAGINQAPKAKPRGARGR